MKIEPFKIEVKVSLCKDFTPKNKNVPNCKPDYKYTAYVCI